jgi:hypothetical protein
MHVIKSQIHLVRKFLLRQKLPPVVFQQIVKSFFLVLQVGVQDVSRVSWERGEADGPGLFSGQELVRWQAAQVRHLEAELGVSHIKEYGITWDQQLEL